MKQTIEKTNLQKTDDVQVDVYLVCETLSDSSQVYNVQLYIFDIKQPYSTFLENYDCTNLGEAKQKYKALIAALDGFVIA